MTAAQVDDAEGHALVAAIHEKHEREAQGYCWPTLGDACGGCHRCVTVPTTTRPIHLPTEPERTGTP